MAVSETRVADRASSAAISAAPLASSTCSSASIAASAPLSCTADTAHSARRPTPMRMKVAPTVPMMR